MALHENNWLDTFAVTAFIILTPGSRRIPLLTYAVGSAERLSSRQSMEKTNTCLFFSLHGPVLYSSSILFSPFLQTPDQIQRHLTEIVQGML